MRIFGSKRRAGIVGLGVATGLVLSAVVYATATFGPTRPTFTWANPASYITFNSITDNPVWGDERQLLKARDSGASSSTNATSTQVKDGEEVLLTAYFHNNAATNLNLVATGTNVKFVLPSQSATSVSPTAYITAGNANPNQVWASADLTSSQPFTITYEAGSAKLYTNYVSGLSLSDSVVNGGTQIGTYGTDGKVPGCAQYSGYVTILVKVHVTPQTPKVSLACTALDADKIDRTRFDFTAHASTQNATVQSFDFTAKDANGNVVDTNTVNTSALSAVYHFDQSAPGTYTVSATVNTNHGSDTNDNCVKQITVATPPVTPPATPPATPKSTPKPTSLPNTGPGDVLGIFGGASAMGGIGHYLVSRRKRG